MTYLNKKGALQKDTLLKNALVHGGYYSNEVMLCQLIFYHFTISALYKMMYKIYFVSERKIGSKFSLPPTILFIYSLFYFPDSDSAGIIP